MKTLNNLEVGDFVVNEYGEKRKILASLGEEGEERVYILSAVELKVAGSWYTAFELKKYGYQLSGEVEEAEELTMEEVCAELGRTIKIKK